MQKLAPSTSSRRLAEPAEAHSRRHLPRPVPPRLHPSVDAVWSFHVMQQQERQIRLAACDATGERNDL